ncbi:DUF3467 domain-containing protein [Endomicrobium proavitum]|uniref:DUF3467 domain-containing protein n=1 Tax=Endomicrobium proavitum TaxID=1408281 RepID=A0A0G3WIZ8_9BACT|nr:DUF3467 domain-containing protein [Endomicrobium proavitum]AKL98298.1 hypothetical protein Epro_0919 [Endomicrobium proavitum]
MEEKKHAEIKIEIDEETSNGVYSNLAMISHSETEFILDFLFFQPQQNSKTKVRTRIITSPAHIKSLIAALQENTAKYEAKYGVIKESAARAGNSKPEYIN